MFICLVLVLKKCKLVKKVVVSIFMVSSKLFDLDVKGERVVFFIYFWVYINGFDGVVLKVKNS